MTTTPTAAIMDASLSSLDQADLLTRRRQVDQIRHEIAGGDEAAARRKDAKLKEACQGFESIFLNKIWTQMRQSLPKEGYLHSKEEDFYQQMFDKELMDKMASNGGLGLGDMLYKHLKESSERVSKATSPSKPTNPLPLAVADTLRLASQVRGTRDGWSAEGAAQTRDAQPQAESDPGLAMVAYAPYGQADAQGGPLDEGFDVQPGALLRPELRPIPAPAIDLQKPAPLQNVLFDPNMPVDGRELTSLDMQAMQAGGQTLGERLASAPIAQAGNMPPASGLESSGAEQLMPAASNAAQSRAAEAYTRADRTAQIPQDAQNPQASQTSQAARPARTAREGRRSNMPLITDPVQGEVTSTFGWRDDPFTGKRAWHSGVDIKAAEGAPVGACWDGTVVFAGSGGQYGNTVVLEHAGGWRTFYGHARDLAVKPGQVVKAGQQIATVGQSGRTTGPHLHFEIRQGGLAWDPQQVKEHLLAGTDKANRS
ncbi:peptidoglycan DD-metalloendopeptidase family protein [Megalodesulfovibrio gigas]|uniref:Putative peptidase M23 n=1 Tax=Megalodesulfovibrio gigas (strain ATCC 19364 / DSM 1382 / NCIMB 9332 / VKM B-1759) TaxID=1121448 RepID=T2G932_MEGG1|nr:peptidoglycan DD-metalloendopeptidase family protein [Megalodesulfovibrio gigas]AGW12427.1 putative peptidase M23 [Megalodesulfovibrio gigas DSM 1382 = ATCC 19364]